MTRHIWRGLLAVAVVLAVGLAALWLSFTAGVWLAVQGPTPTQLVTGGAFVAMLGMLARALVLLAGTLREPESE